MLEQENELFKKEINEITQSHRRRIGANKVRYLLKCKGYNVGVERVRKLMIELGVMKRVYVQKRYSHLKKYIGVENLLKREFQQTFKNKVWVGDITYLPVGEKFYYLSVVIDLYSRKVISYCLSDSLSSMIVESSILDAFEVRERTPEMFHSDRGSQYMSNTFKDILADKGVMHSLSMPYTPKDNAVVESFFSSMKKELFITKGKSISTYEVLREMIKEYVTYFNERRPHKYLDYRTPDFIDSL